MKKTIIVLFVLLLTTLGVTAQPSAKTYDELLAKLKGGDISIDFKALRFAYTRDTGV